MKKFLALLFFLPMVVYSQKLDKYDQLLKKMQIKQQSEMMVNGLIDAYAKQKPNVPAAVWQDIKKIHFNDVYLKEVKKVFQENYTEAEVRELMATVDKYGINAYKPNPAITEKLYEVGKNFGKSVGAQIQNKLKKLGY